MTVSPWMEEVQRRDRNRQAIKALFVANTEVFQRFHRVVQAYFREEAEGKSYQRRPKLSWTLPVLGPPYGRLVVYPYWDQQAKSLNLSRTVLELLEETIYDYRRTESGVAVTDKECTLTGYCAYNGPESLQQVLDVLADFMVDPFSVWRGSRDFCSRCGKGLTDEVSRTRGIGPECWKFAMALEKYVRLATRRCAAAEA